MPHLMWDTLVQRLTWCWRCCAVLLGLLVFAGSSGGQEPACTTQSGFPLPLTPVPTKEPRPAEVLSKFVDKLQGSETAFEVIVGQGKILNLKEDLGAAGKPMLPLLAVGDPAIVGLV